MSTCYCVNARCQLTSSSICFSALFSSISWNCFPSYLVQPRFSYLPLKSSSGISASLPSTTFHHLPLPCTASFHSLLASSSFGLLNLQRDLLHVNLVITSLLITFLQFPLPSPDSSPSHFTQSTNSSSHAPTYWPPLYLRVFCLHRPTVYS